MKEKTAHKGGRLEKKIHVTWLNCRWLWGIHNLREGWRLWRDRFSSHDNLSPHLRPSGEMFSATRDVNDLSVFYGWIWHCVFNIFRACHHCLIVERRQGHSITVADECDSESLWIIQEEHFTFTLSIDTHTREQLSQQNEWFIFRSRMTIRTASPTSEWVSGGRECISGNTLEHCPAESFTRRRTQWEMISTRSPEWFVRTEKIEKSHWRTAWPCRRHTMELDLESQIEVTDPLVHFDTPWDYYFHGRKVGRAGWSFLLFVLSFSHLFTWHLEILI